MAHKDDLKFLMNRAKAFGDSGAWLLIIVGLLLFVARVPFAPGGVINLPVAVTVFQTAGLMFTIAGLQIMISRLVWPNISVSRLMNSILDPDEGQSPLASAVMLAGLFIYNGVTTIAFVTWLASAMGAGIAAAG
jgi:hypothetical protein